METFRQGGDSLAGRYFAFRLHPFSVREWCEHTTMLPDDALDHLMARGGFPEPCLAGDSVSADRWRMQYFNDLIREDVLEFSRVHGINTMRLFVELLRESVGSSLSLASMARDLAVATGDLETLFGYFTGVIYCLHRSTVALQHCPRSSAKPQGKFF